MTLIRRRAFQPVTLALTWAATVLAAGWLITDRFDGPWDAVLAGSALAVAVLFTIAWALEDTRTARVGYLLSVGLWTFVAVAAYAGIRSITSAGIAVGWMLLAAGCYWIDVRRPV